MAKKRKILFLIFMIISVALSISVYAAAATEQAQVSPALDIIAKDMSIAKSAKAGEEVSFNAEELEQALRVSAISSLTITKLPDEADGVLYLGGAEVQCNQVISRAHLPYLKFAFSGEEITDSSFCFSSNFGSYSIQCNVYSLNGENVSPTVDDVDDQALFASTYRDIQVFGKMDAYDADGDPLTYEVVSYPQNGLLIQTDAVTGDYRYVPNAGYVGNDSFTYVAVDKYGNYSNEAKVEIKVTERLGELVYEDLTDNAVHVAAISLTELGIMASTSLDGSYYFYPDKEITRGEFLVMTMKVLGIEVQASNERTVFADDADILPEQRGYINVAEKLGYICGKIDSAGQLVFAPNEGITRAEAAVMICNMKELDLPVVQIVFADQREIPAWAKDAIQAVTFAGLMTHEQGCVSPCATMKRGEVAQVLYLLDNMNKRGN